MIRCLLIQITVNRRGKPAREERSIVGETLRIGRGTDCNIHLADPRVNLHHATIKQADDGQFFIEGSDVISNGAMSFKDRLRPGTAVLIGPYQLTVAPAAAEHDLALTIELLHPLAEARAQLREKSRTSLAAVGWSKRTLALGLLTIITLAFLVFPVLYAVAPTFRHETAHLPIAPDESWNPGPISAAHQFFAKNCNECHQIPFVHVQDQACLSCHKTIGNHIADQTLQAAAFGDSRCAQCHREHKGVHGLAQTNPSLCVDCHSNIKSHAAGTGLIDINDFLNGHPPFQLSIKTGPTASELKRVTQDSNNKLVEHSGLKFPHDLHLAAKGVKSPDGMIVLSCKSCHTLDEAGVRFKPVAMKAQCASCHLLTFEPAVTARQVPHGSVHEVMTTLREFYASISIGDTPIDVITVDGLLRRPTSGKTDVARQQAQAWANAKADSIAKDLFEVRVCTTCHQVQAQPGNHDAPWQITAVTITENWLPKARFEHSKHGSVECSQCHDVSHSSKSSDVAIPTIGQCRECHVGAQPVRNKITSTCETCHDFHRDNHPDSSGLLTRQLPAQPGVMVTHQELLERP